MAFSKTSIFLKQFYSVHFFRKRMSDSEPEEVEENNDNVNAGDDGRSVRDM
jgi:hypothetical protein